MVFKKRMSGSVMVLKNEGEGDGVYEDDDVHGGCDEYGVTA